jgi:recombination protein RecA
MNDICESVRRAIMAKTETQESIWFSTGCDLLDLVVGGGLGLGFPSGKVINIVGDTSTGKTFLAWEIIAAAIQRYRKRFKYKYDGAEYGNTFDPFSLYGIDWDSEKDQLHSRTVEEMACNYTLFLDSLKDGECGIYVVDSLDGLSSKENQERTAERLKAFESNKEFKQGSYQMGGPKFLSQEFFKEITAKTEKKNCLLIIISQLRDNVELFSREKDKRAGGRALDFYAHTALYLANLTKIKRKETTVGVVVRGRTKKSKTPRPYRDCIFTLIFDYGLDNIGANLDYLFDLREDSGVLNKNAKEILWEGKEQTVASLQEFLEQTGEIENYKKEYKQVKKTDMLEFIKGTPTLKESFDKTFGISMTRDELIQYVEENKLQSQLRERVIAKWENFETSIKTCRAPKYQE